MTEEGIKLVMRALAGEPIVTTAKFADEVEKALREYKEREENEKICATSNR